MRTSTDLRGAGYTLVLSWILLHAGSYTRSTPPRCGLYGPSSRTRSGRSPFGSSPLYAARFTRFLLLPAPLSQLVGQSCDVWGVFSQSLVPSPPPALPSAAARHRCNVCAHSARRDDARSPVSRRPQLSSSADEPSSTAYGALAQAVSSSSTASLLFTTPDSGGRRLGAKHRHPCHLEASNLGAAGAGARSQRSRRHRRRASPSSVGALSRGVRRRRDARVG